MVRQWQRLFYGKRFSNTTLDKKTDYDMVAKGLGANAFTVTNAEEFEAAIQAALADKTKPALINCVVNPDNNVLPMVPGRRVDRGADPGDQLRLTRMDPKIDNNNLERRL